MGHYIQRHLFTVVEKWLPSFNVFIEFWAKIAQLAYYFRSTVLQLCVRQVDHQFVSLRSLTFT